VIHGCLYQLRPDINAVCHFHSQAIVPFCATDTPLVPVTHVGATIGTGVPVWSSQKEFGDTNLLVVSQEEGLSLARAMGDGWTLLMTHHGGVVGGRSIREAVFRAIQLCRNAEAQIRAMQIGKLKPLTDREVEMAGAFNLGEPVLERAWNYWKKRLQGQPIAAAAE
jgi:ribulose-5-phosphate 4-epimerase/fuculose-1-phosphate aldolase